MQQVLFHFSRSTDIKILSWYKQFGQYKTFLEKNLWRRKQHFTKYFVGCKIF